MRKAAVICAISLFSVALALGNARAQDDGNAQDRVVAGEAQPLERILPGIRRSHPGRFYDAEGPFPGADGEMHYRLKWMTPEGRIIWLDADARTGRVLSEGGGRYDYQRMSVPADRVNADRPSADNPRERRPFTESDSNRYGDQRWGNPRYDREPRPPRDYGSPYGRPNDGPYRERDRDWGRGDHGDWGRGRQPEVGHHPRDR